MRGTVLADQGSSKEVGERTARTGAFCQLGSCRASHKGIVALEQLR